MTTKQIVIECPIVEGKGASREDIRDSLGSRWPNRFKVKFMVDLSKESIRLIHKKHLAVAVQLKPGKQQVTCIINGMEWASVVSLVDDWEAAISNTFTLKGELCFQGSCRDGVRFMIPQYRTDKRTGIICISDY